jgi:glutamate/tyrosine decarboxylase-like PLP-dependent enzyme
MGLRQRLGEAWRSAERRALHVAKKIPFVRNKMEAQYASMVAGMEKSLKPYRDELPRHRALPAAGRERVAILREMEALQQREEPRADGGFVSGAVYHGGAEHGRFLSEVYALHLNGNPLHSDVWPSLTKYEAEIVQMTATMLGADPEDRSDGRVVGTVTSGGSESIFMAVKAYRDLARTEHGVRAPELVLPTTAHVAFDKACHYLGIRPVKIAIGEDLRASVDEARAAIGRHTIAVVGSAPGFPHGLIDPIEELSELARSRRVGFHTDACLGGFILPWARRLGYPVPRFHFELPGVTSMSADTHKFGYAPKGTSVVLYRGVELRRHQYFTAPDWPGGLYASPTAAGSRPGALSAGCWAAMLSMGEEGYLTATRRILETAAKIKKGIGEIPGLQVLGDPLFVVAFASEGYDIYRLLDAMSHRGWSLNGLHRPACIHLCVTLRHAEPGVAERFLSDLGACVDEVRARPAEKGGMAPIYGMAGSLPFAGVVSEVLTRYLDVLYEP